MSQSRSICFFWYKKLSGHFGSKRIKIKILSTNFECSFWSRYYQPILALHREKRIGYRLLFAFLGFFKTRFWPIFCTGMQIISNRFIEMYISLFYLQREVCSVLSNFGHISGFLDLTLNCWNFLTRFFFWLLTKHQKAIWYGFHP